MTSGTVATGPLPTADDVLDARGLRCPMPLLRARQALRHLPSGHTLLVRATDAGSRRDIPAYLRQSGHELVRSGEVDEEFWFLIRTAKGDS
ncbi:sulfurtransferase TusA family protein [Isoalcanivorax indicus]|uniref:sulfurtransferase TusA family protein n=1 Tax=Isoalcanivorax indicus TaxID=2202653 RepID=UPI000DB9E6C4|nr:sulfurtransferase TusA family protein [Isoalcanivorax indicus]